MSRRVSLVFYYKSTNTYALNVLVGAVQSRVRSGDLEIRLIRRVEQLIASVQSALAKNRLVIVG